jgi:hypothetical protein
MTKRYKGDGRGRPADVSPATDDLSLRDSARDRAGRAAGYNASDLVPCNGPPVLLPHRGVMLEWTSSDERSEIRESHLSKMLYRIAA